MRRMTDEDVDVNTALGLTAWAAAAVVYVAAHAVDTEFSMFWVFGLAFGFVLQRARFCFASAFSAVSGSVWTSKAPRSCADKR